MEKVRKSDFGFIKQFMTASNEMCKSVCRFAAT
jgi:hypothetical protein